MPNFLIRNFHLRIRSNNRKLNIHSNNWKLEIELLKN